MNATVVAGWLICPRCGSRTKTRVNSNTTLTDFPLYCGKCKHETVVSVRQS